MAGSFTPQYVIPNIKIGVVSIAEGPGFEPRLRRPERRVPPITLSLNVATCRKVFTPPFTPTRTTGKHFSLVVAGTDFYRIFLSHVPGRVKLSVPNFSSDSK